MEQNNTYKYLSVVLAIVAITFAVLYFTKPSQPVSETFQDISDSAGQCRDRLETWKMENTGKATTTQDSRDSLQKILDECADIFKDSQEKI